MPDPKSRAKLTASQKLEVLSFLAFGFKPQYIADHIFDKYGIEVSRENIYQNYAVNPAYKNRIERLRKIKEERTADIPCATKTGRLEIIQKAIEEALTWRTDKLYFDKFGDEVGKIEKRVIGVIPALVNEARVEMGGNDSKDNQGFDTFFVELIRKHNEELKEKGIDGFRITKFENRVLGRYISK